MKLNTTKILCLGLLTYFILPAKGRAAPANTLILHIRLSLLQGHDLVTERRWGKWVDHSDYNYTLVMRLPHDALSLGVEGGGVMMGLGLVYTCTAPPRMGLYGKPHTPISRTRDGNILDNCCFSSPVRVIIGRIYTGSQYQHGTT
jgi:hypothetical protein